MKSPEPGERGIGELENIKHHQISSRHESIQEIIVDSNMLVSPKVDPSKLKLLKSPRTKENIKDLQVQTNFNS